MNDSSTLSFEEMTWEDVPEVMQVDQRSFTLPWSLQTYQHEISSNNTSHYYVLRLQPEPLPRKRGVFSRLSRRKGHVPIVAYGGFWLVEDEAHISTIAVDVNWRGRGLGEIMLMAMIEQAIKLNARKVTLEVRETNVVAQNLYRKYGFVVMGKRPRYYRDNNEDALLMLASDVDSRAYRRTFQRLSAGALQRLRAGGLSMLQRMPVEQDA